MSNIETFYFMTFLTDLAAFSPAIAGLINSVFSIVDACLSWIYGGILNGTKAKKWGRYRSWLILVPWIVPFLYAFQFIRVSGNEMLSAVIIIAAAIASHVVWNIGYVANAAKVSIPDMFKSLFANPQLMILMVADLSKWCVKFVTAAAAIYYFRDAMGNPGLMTPYLLAIGLAAIVGYKLTREKIAECQAAISAK